VTWVEKTNDVGKGDDGVGKGGDSVRKGGKGF